MHIMEWKELLDKCTKELKEKIQEIKNINDLEKQYLRIIGAKNIFGIGGKLTILKQARPGSVVGYISYLDEYEKLLSELEDLHGEVSKKSNQEERESKNKQSKKKTDTPSKKQKQYTCAECGEVKKGKYKYSKTKKDNQKFCSDNCFYIHYAEKCDNCLEKCLKYSGGKAVGSSDTYYSDKENKTGTLCSKCHQEQLKEENEQEKKDKEWEKSFKKLEKAMDNLVDGMVDVAGKDKENEEEDSGGDSNNNGDGNNNKNKNNNIKT